MDTQPEESSYGDKMANTLAKLIPVFIESYETLQGNMPATGMPRRLQLSSLVWRLLLQDAKLATEISGAFFSDEDVRNFFGSKQSADTAFRQLIFDNNCCVVDNSGVGGMQQSIAVVSNVFLAAVDLCVLDKGILDKTVIKANLHKTIMDFKSFVHGKEVEEIHLIGFSGFTTEDGIRIGFGDLNAFPLNAFQASYFFGASNNIGFVIREAFHRKKLFAGTAAQMQSFFSEGKCLVDEKFFTEMRLLVKNVRLALVLALSDHKRAFPSFVAGDYLITSTGNLNSFIFPDPTSNHKPIVTKLDQKSVNKLSIKYLTIVDADLSSVEVAIKRLLSAVCSRDNDDDALIDAVMCWENIIGSEAEVTFRTCASIAKLLKKDETCGLEVYKDLKEVYSARSSLVHGNSKYKTEPEITRRAVFYAIGLLNAILEDNVLLRMDSAKRSEHILLDRR